MEPKKPNNRKGVPKMENPPKPPKKKETKPRRTKNNPDARTRTERTLDVLQLVENQGFSVLKACNNVKISRGEFFEEIDSSPELTDKYTRARERRSDMLLEEIIDIADNDTKDEKAFVGVNHIKRANLRIEARLKYLSTLHPKKYGSKVDVNLSGELEVKTITGMVIENNSEEKPEGDK